jgi:hypothetical protein
MQQQQQQPTPKWMAIPNDDIVYAADSDAWHLLLVTVQHCH